MKIANKKLINFSLFYAIAIFAITLTTTSPILIEISHTVSKDISQMGLLFTLFSTGFVVGSLLSGVLSKFFSKYSILMTTFLLQSVFLFIFSFSKTYIFALTIYFIIGMSGGFSETLASILLTEINKGKEGYYLNISQVFCGIGAFIGPYISSTSIKLGTNWSAAYYIVSALAFINFAIFISLKFKYAITIAPATNTRFKGQPSNPSIDLKRWSLPTILILSISSLAIFMYTASEAGLTVWLPTFLRIEKVMGNLESGQVLSFFWLAIAGGRLISGLLSNKINLAKLTIALSIFGLIFVILGLLASDKFINFLSFLIAGFFYSGIWPNIVAYSSRYFDKNKDVAISIIITCAGAGALFAPWLVGVIYKHMNLLTGLLVCAVFLFIEMLLMLVLYLHISKNKNQKWHLYY
jgi:FHS family glucose/mannose:H+ symporter-like MFS transporter